MITKEGMIIIEDGKLFLHGFHFKATNNFDDNRKAIISYIDNILKEENFVPINCVYVSDEYQESGKELPL